MQDWITSQNLILRCGSDSLSWENFCSALEACLFYCPSVLLSSSTLLNIVISRYLRWRVHRPSGNALTLKEAILAQQNCSLGATDPRDYVFSMSRMLSLGEEQPDVPTMDYRADSAQVFLRTSQSLGLLSLSLAERKSHQFGRMPSWACDLSVPMKTFVLNHPKSSFWASPVHKESCVHEEDIMHTEGMILDNVKSTANYLPPRRHCDHYHVEGYNNVTFTEWIQFAKDKRPRALLKDGLDTRTLLEFADTIQARGCNSIWEQGTPIDPEDRFRQLWNFLRFLEDEEMKATLEIRLFYAACFPSHGRKFGITGRGKFCLLPKDAKRDDLICILHGNRVPVVFRRKDEHYVNLGECYVVGCMKNEMGTMLDSSKFEHFSVV